MNHRSITDCLIHEDPAALAKLADAGSNYIRARIREGDARDLFTHMLLDPETKPVRKIARVFARLVAEHVGDKTALIDRLNLTGPVSVCASHDYCDSNVFMAEALQDVTGLDAASELPEMSERTRKLWDYSWRYTKLIGFHRLSALRGDPDSPPEDIAVDYSLAERAMTVTLPTAPPLEDGAFPLDIELDYCGRNPHLQVLCRNHGDAEGEPAVCVRYDQDGKVVEVIIGDPKVLVVGDFDVTRVRTHKGTGDTPWEIEREANPVCMDGDKLKMPSGQVADVMRLRDRYDNDIEEFRAFSNTYGILARMDSYPGSGPRHQVYDSIEQAWEINPLTAATTDPSDCSCVPEHPERKVAEGSVDGYTILCGGHPVVTITEPPRWKLFQSERAAQISLAEAVERTTREFKCVGLPYEDFEKELRVVQATLHADGTMTTESGNHKLPEPHEAS